MMAREMKDSGIEWIGEIPKNWRLEKGKYFFSQRSEKGNEIDVQLLSPTQKYGVIPQNVYEKLSGMKAVKLDASANLSEFKSIYEGDFCISLRSFQGGFEYSRYNGVVSPAYQVFHANSPNISDSYYRFLFKEQSFIVYMTSFTKTFRDGKSIAYGDFANSIIPIPPLSEQEKIATFLDSECARIEEVISKTKSTIEEYKKLKQSVITEAVTKGIRTNREMKDSGIEWIGEIPKEWGITCIKRFCKLQTGSTPSTANNEWFDGSLDWFTPCDFNEQYLLSNSQRKLSEKAKADNVATIIPENTVLIIGIGGTAGKIGMTTCECSCNQQITALITKKLVGRYLMYWLIANTKILKETALYTTLPILNNETIGEYLLLVPFGSEQQEIADFLDCNCAKIDILIAKKEQIVSELESYKKSLIYEYVTGKKEVV